MHDVFWTADRLREEANEPSNLALNPAPILTRLYPARCVLLPDLTVSRLQEYLERRVRWHHPTLVTCRDRRLRGGIVAFQGHAFLFADEADAENERQFTLAHEAFHYLADHLYPRKDLLERFGPSIQPVLDGERQATRAEEIDAILGRTSLTLQTHLMDRDRTDPFIAIREHEADLFACEILAPRAGLEARFPRLLATAAAHPAVQNVLLEEFHLPPIPAEAWARWFVHSHGEPVSRLDRMGLAARVT